MPVKNGYARLLGYQVSCWACHDLARLQVVHFTGLETYRSDGNPQPSHWFMQPPSCLTAIFGCHPGQFPW